MTERLLLGDHPTYGPGAYASMPGINVYSASKYQMTWSTIFEMFQIAQTGSTVVSINPSSGSFPFTSISWNALGFRPIVLLSSNWYEIYFQYTSDNTAQMRGTNSSEAGWSNGSSNPVPSSDTVRFIVTRTPLLP